MRDIVSSRRLIRNALRIRGLVGCRETPVILIKLGAIRIYEKSDPWGIKPHKAPVATPLGSCKTWRILLRLSIFAVAIIATFATPGFAQAQLRVRVTLQPECFRNSAQGECERFRASGRPDLPPQIAIWIAKPDGSFVDTLMVTNLVGLLGIGNRPGTWRHASNYRFPYGKRIMALPVWAHQRGKLYDNLIIQDFKQSDRENMELWLGFHELVSSREPYFCRPLSQQEGAAAVDAVSCPSPNFNSAKGRAVRAGDTRSGDTDPPPLKTYYPPRNDIKTVSRQDCDDSGQQSNMNCLAAVRGFADVNDLDAVATATPPYGRTFTKSWTVPTDLPDGDYMIWVEVGKEFDNNSSFNFVSLTDPQLSDAGLKNNIGQPAVVYSVPIRIDRKQGFQGSASDITGYGAWDGKTGILNPPDNKIGNLPGSGRGRLLLISQPSIVVGDPPLSGHVLVSTTAPPPIKPSPPIDAQAAMDTAPDAIPVDAPAPPDAVAGAVAIPVCAVNSAEVQGLSAPKDAVAAESARVSFQEPFALTDVDEYEIRFWEGDDQTDTAYKSGLPTSPEPRGQPGGNRSVALKPLQNLTTYTMGIRPTGACGDGVIKYFTFTTPVKTFVQLSGCFIATAAYGTSMAVEVEALRRARNLSRDASSFITTIVDLYERSSPPIASLVRDNDSLRALARVALAPIVRAVQAAESLTRH